VAAQLEAEHGTPVPYTTATMIETPRAALRAAAIAPLVDAFSFGTNDLSQLTFGFSRDDVSANYIPAALAGGQLEHDPFRTLDATRCAAARRASRSRRDARRTRTS
jgi:pyruvate, orthophosphate dikinase